MPRFFFHLTLGQTCVQDTEGVELLSAEEAVREGSKAFAEFLSEDRPDITGLILMDEAGEVLLESRTSTRKLASADNP